LHKIGSIILFSAICIVFACNSKNNTKNRNFANLEFTNDSTKNFINYSNSVFCVPSPHLTNLYLKQLKIYPDHSIVNPIINIEKYTTSVKKALNIGVYGVDLGYMNIFSASENSNAYINGLKTLSDDLGLQAIFTFDTYNDLIKLKNNEDSLTNYLSALFNKADTYLKNNSEQKLATLIITGGWFEGFYLLCNTYNQTKKKEIKNLIYHQKFILDNIIKSLAPYYDSSDELQQLIDNLVEIAYEFDVLDFKFSYNDPAYLVKKNVVVFYNVVIVGNGEQTLDDIILKVEKLRELLVL
jgi:hypothetical protein